MEVKNLLQFSTHSSSLLDEKATILAKSGGIQQPGSKKLASQFATEVLETLTQTELDLIEKFKNQSISFLVVRSPISDKSPPPSQESIPSVSELEKEFDVLKLAARSQILLSIVNQKAFAYDIDNEGKITRLVANFKGGGVKKIDNEDQEDVVKSSHAGIALNAHTETPYHIALGVKDGHSPAPSALILTALWNPLSEPTSVIPIEPILRELEIENLLALATPSFDFTRSETFNEGEGSAGTKVPILEIDDNGLYGVKYNSYRFSVNASASEFIRISFEKFKDKVLDAKPYPVNLDNDTTLIINNTRALHCRDIVKDNRRVLVRLFGYWNDRDYIEVRDDPLVVKG